MRQSLPEARFKNKKSVLEIEPKGRGWEFKAMLSFVKIQKLVVVLSIVTVVGSGMLFSAGCGVKGDPEPPLTAPSIGRGSSDFVPVVDVPGTGPNAVPVKSTDAEPKKK